MKREEQIEKASVEYQLSKRPMAIGGDVFEDMVYKMNINPTFIAGAKWSDENPNPELKKEFIDNVCEWIEDNINEKYIRYTLDGCRDPEIEYWRIVEDLRKYIEEQQ